MKLITEEEMKEVLDGALSDGVITEEQYRELLSRSEQEEEKRGKIESFLIASGVIVLIIAVIIVLMMTFNDMSYRAILTTLSLIAVSVLVGGIYTKKTDFTNLHYGLIAGASNLIVLPYGYWLVHDLKHPLLGIPLILVPFIALYYLIDNNSRLGSQGGLLSLLIGSFFIFIRVISWDDGYVSFKTAYFIIGIIALMFFIFSIVINILWTQGYLKNWKQIYEDRTKTFHSLLSSGYILASIYIWYGYAVFEIVHENPIGNGAFFIFFITFIVLGYAVWTKKEGLILSSCGMIIFTMWISALTSVNSGGFFFIIILGILTALILLGMAWFFRRYSNIMG